MNKFLQLKVKLKLLKQAICIKTDRNKLKYLMNSVNR